MKYLFANWKMYLDLKESMALAQAVGERGIKNDDHVELAVFPTTLALTGVAWALRGSNIPLGAQNCSWVSRGAYTGAISAHMLKDAGCFYVLCGHSERRHIFGETDMDVRKKVDAALDAGLVPVVCIGETKEEKDAGKREYRLKKQIMTVFEKLYLGEKKIMIAYEPVWAIGTGDACAPADADDVHGWVRQEIRQYTDLTVPILYGGSVTADNVGTYLARDMVDGVLVGSASAKQDSLFSLIDAARA